MRRLTLKDATLLALAIITIVFLLLFQTPREFVPDTLVTIEPGSSFSSAAQELKDRDVITSTLLLRALMVFAGGTRSLQAGDYFFKEAQGTLAIAHRLAQGEYGLTRVRVLLPEGSSSADMATILAKQMPRIDAKEFSVLAKPYEGYLFPDTYFFSPTATSGEVIAHLRQTFDEKTHDALSASSTHAKDDIIIMASILEEEARTPEDRQIVAGILWKRLQEGKRLQVDAPFMYLLGKTSSELTQDDLALESPYNTYLYPGLPPTPITNPGIESIVAAANPTTTPYWFYLSDEEGDMHYAKTFEEHLVNKQKYIK